MAKSVHNSLGISVDLEELSRPGIYFLLQGEQIVYVGKSESDVHVRIKSHLLDEDKKFNGAFYKPVTNNNHLEFIEQIEQSYILEHNPKYNKAKYSYLEPLKENIIDKFESGKKLYKKDFIPDVKEYERLKTLRLKKQELVEKKKAVA